MHRAIHVARAASIGNEGSLRTRCRFYEVLLAKPEGSIRLEDDGEIFVHGWIQRLTIRQRVRKCRVLLSSIVMDLNHHPSIKTRVPFVAIKGAEVILGDPVESAGYVVSWVRLNAEHSLGP